MGWGCPFTLPDGQKVIKTTPWGQISIILVSFSTFWSHFRPLAIDFQLIGDQKELSHPDRTTLYYWLQRVGYINHTIWSYIRTIEFFFSAVRNAIDESTFLIPFYSIILRYLPLDAIITQHCIALSYDLLLLAIESWVYQSHDLVIHTYDFFFGCTVRNAIDESTFLRPVTASKIDHFDQIVDPDDLESSIPSARSTNLRSRGPARRLGPQKR